MKNYFIYLPNRKAPDPWECGTGWENIRRDSAGPCGGERWRADCGECAGSCRDGAEGASGWWSFWEVEKVDAAW